MADTPLDRRRVLALGAMGSVAALASSWLAACGRSDGRRPDDAGDPAGAGAGSISDAPTTRAGGPDRARALGRPLLVLVAPADESRQHEVGSVLGSFLTHGDDEALADVACCEVVCLSATRLEERGHAVGPDTWMVLMDGDRIVPIVAALAPRPELQWNEHGSLDAYDRAYGEAVRAEIRILASGLRAALVPSRARLEARAAAIQVLLSAEDRAAVAGVIAGREAADGRLVERAAALLRLAAETHPPERARVIALLAASARRRLERAPAGSRWGDNYGCGLHVEGEPAPGFACGMGHVPRIGARFLALWTAR